jgi:hypothetical protein
MSEQAPAITGIAALAVDCHDPAGLARWWSRLLGGEVEATRPGSAGAGRRWRRTAPGCM